MAYIKRDIEEKIISLYKTFTTIKRGRTFHAASLLFVIWFYFVPSWRETLCRRICVNLFNHAPDTQPN